MKDGERQGDGGLDLTAGVCSIDDFIGDFERRENECENRFRAGDDILSSCSTLKDHGIAGKPSLVPF